MPAIVSLCYSVCLMNTLYGKNKFEAVISKGSLKWGENSEV